MRLLDAFRGLGNMCSGADSDPPRGGVPDSMDEEGEDPPLCMCWNGEEKFRFEGAQVALEPENPRRDGLLELCTFSGEVALGGSEVAQLPGGDVSMGVGPWRFGGGVHSDPSRSTYLSRFPWPREDTSPLGARISGRGTSRMRLLDAFRGLGNMCSAGDSDPPEGRCALPVRFPPPKVRFPSRTEPKHLFVFLDPNICLYFAFSRI